MPDLQTAPTQTANNISAAIIDKANGKLPVETSKDGKAAPVQADPNAGKKKYVVGGKEYWLTPEQEAQYAQKGIGYEPKVSEYARLQQETQAFLRTLETNPEKIIFNPKFGKPEEVLSRLLNSTQVSEGVKTAIGQWYYENVVRQEKMDPKEREALEWKKKAESYESEKKRLEAERIESENKARIEYALNQVKMQIAEAMKESGLPNIDTPTGTMISKRVADLMRMSFLAKRPITPKDAISRVRQEILDFQKAYYDSLDEEKLVEQLGKENAEKVRKYFLKAVKAAEKEVKMSGDAPSKKRNERETMTPDQFRDYLDDLKHKNGK